MILACHDVSKAFGEHVIIQNGSFHIEDHEKAALVGINGAGKSTLLKMIVGDLTADGGTITLTKGKTLGYLSQHQELVSGNTIYEEVRSAKADVIAMESRIREIEKELKDLTGDELPQWGGRDHNLVKCFLVQPLYIQILSNGIKASVHGSQRNHTGNQKVQIGLSM